MKILLINPPMNLRKTLGDYEDFMEPMPCIGLAYIASTVRESGHDVEVIDAFAEKSSLGEIVEMVKDIDPDVVGISCLTPTAYNSFRISERVQNLEKDIPVIMGNLHAQIFGEDILEKGYADIAVECEGEEATVEILDALGGSGDLDGIKGIKYRSDGNIKSNGPREKIKSLDDLSYPAWDLFPYEKYGSLPFTNVERPILGVLGSRGCPFSCTFCSNSEEYRGREPSNIVDEIEYLVDEYGAKQIAFMDLIFPLTKEIGVEFSEEMISRGLHKDVVWSTESRVDKIDRELVSKMKEAGCRRLMFGIESGNQKILNRFASFLILHNTPTNFSIRSVHREEHEPYYVQLCI